jgi:hypothetical protein
MSEEGFPTATSKGKPVHPENNSQHETSKTVGGLR